MRVDVCDGRSPDDFLTKNISVGGLFLITGDPYNVGDKLPLRLSYDGLTVDVDSRVTHVQRDGIGVTFWNPTRSVEETVNRVIDELLELGYTNNERRRELRYLVPNTPVVWRSGELDYPGELADLSFHGARLRAVQQPARGERILLMLPTSSLDGGNEELELVGSPVIVRRVIADQFGVEFDGPSAEFRRAVATVLKLMGKSAN